MEQRQSTVEQIITLRERKKEVEGRGAEIKKSSPESACIIEDS